MGYARQTKRTIIRRKANGNAKKIRRRKKKR